MGESRREDWPRDAFEIAGHQRNRNGEIVAEVQCLTRPVNGLPVGTTRKISLEKKKGRRCRDVEK